MSTKDSGLPPQVPQHVAVIMDGNGRWAKEQGQFRVYGHRHGVRAVKETVEAAAEMGVKYLTLYAFSSENWNRPKSEVEALMALLVSTIHQETDTLMKNNIRLLAIGDLASLPAHCIGELQDAIEKTAANTHLNLVLALSYSARWEIAEAMKKMAEDVTSGKLISSQINETMVKAYLSTKDIPDPELLIRTSGELRVSNFLLWQIAYTELYFTEKFWPEFRKADFVAAIHEYSRRERRFGKTSEQLNEPAANA